jgi:TM2 domain-containing membrane protein YozV
MKKSEKSATVALLLILFVPIGAHRFYVGKVGTGLLYLFTLGGVGIWALIDLILVITGAFKDSEGAVLKF